MSQKLEKLKILLKELFQLDQPDLDFGFYRIMHAKSAEVTQFLDKDLLPQVKEAFSLYQSADKGALEKELAKTLEQAQALGADPESLPKVKDLREKLASTSVDVSALESEVYDHLFSFFRRYYSEGDFLSKRVYKPGVYAIPYEGEEVKLHWANADQYYIKTSEYLRDYAFRLQPDDEAKPMRVHFRLVEAAEGEHGNVKAAEGKERRFKLAEDAPVALEDDELIVRFTYAPDPAKQNDLNGAAERTLLAIKEPDLADWIMKLSVRHRRADGTEAENNRLRVNLDRYTARNTFDYFIHKDLSTFLRRELDFYVKNEVMHLDDIENECAPRVEQYLSKVRVIRRIANKIIDFLAQLEDFQKKLWLKKRFVSETSWCIRLGIIPKEFLVEIAENNAQREEWAQLLSIDKDMGDLATPGYSNPLTREFLESNPSLLLDTKNFDADFTERLVDSIRDVDDLVDAVLFHSENFQALSSMQRRYREKVQCIYIDPPYNTGGDGFAYKDNYQHSSWLSLMDSRMTLSRQLLSPGGLFLSSCDDHEYDRLRTLASTVFGESNLLTPFIWKNKAGGGDDSTHVAAEHEYVLAAASEASSLELSRIAHESPSMTAKYNKAEGGRRYYLERLDKTSLTYSASMDFPIEGPNGEQIRPPQKDHLNPTTIWRWSAKKVAERRDELIFQHDKSGELRIYTKTWEPSERGVTPRSLLTEASHGRNREGTVELGNLFLTRVFRHPKPTALLTHLLRLCSGQGDVIDFFAGSGTTGHAMINLNREDGGQRKFILVEMGDHFDTVLIPRLKKVTFSPEWKEGKPVRPATHEEAERSPRIMKVVRLESYEDTFNNLEFHRTPQQQGLLDLAAAQGADRLKEQYMLRYQLDVESRGSQSLLNIAAFSDPTAYTLKVKRPGSDESCEMAVDLLETFNWLIGLTVQHLAAPQVFTADFERDGEGRLRLKTRIQQDAAGPYWFRTVTGTTPEGRRTLVIWRKLSGDPEQDNLVLDQWFTKQGYSSKDSEFDLIYVNGGNNLENLKTPDDFWKVRLIEEDFQRLMFEQEVA